MKSGRYVGGSSIINFILNNADSPRLEYELACALEDNLGLDSWEARRIAEPRIKAFGGSGELCCGDF